MAPMPVVMSLDDRAPTIAEAGGKGASLGRLVRAGMPVPPGFCVTTAAYDGFLDGSGLREQLTSALGCVDASDPETFEAASRRIGALFGEAAVPASST
jgi:rifampicin phosphotransferase